MKKAIFFTIVFVLVFFLKAFSLTLNSVNVTKISPSKENIIFDFDNLKDYAYIRLSNELLYIGVEPCIVDNELKPKFEIKNILLKTLPNQTRVYFKLDPNYEYSINILKPNNKNLIISLNLEAKSNNISLKKDETTFQTSPSNETASNQKMPPIITAVVPKIAINTKNITVVLDPGHGGKDSGAVGVGGLKEKDIVLDIAKTTAKILKEMGFSVVLTRDSDIFIPLAQRVKIANDAHADLFVSIHANASLDPSAKGMEVFFLNATSNQKALKIAALENHVPLEQMGTINKILISLINQTKLKKSATFARYVDDKMYENTKPMYSGLINRGIDQAPFYVLVGTNCPSILVETLFITNPHDSKYLSNADYQNNIAKGIADGIIKYLDNKKSN